MVWNPSPEVAIARDFGSKFGADRVIIFYSKPDGTYAYSSFGTTRQLCKEAQEVADTVFGQIGEAFATAGNEA
jgi:hypothetical protein